MQGTWGVPIFCLILNVIEAGWVFIMAACVIVFIAEEFGIPGSQVFISLILECRAFPCGDADRECSAFYQDTAISMGNIVMKIMYYGVQGISLNSS